MATSTGTTPDPAPAPAPTAPLTAEEKADQARQLPPSGAAPAYEAYRKEIEDEYGQFVATTQIYVGNALAYNPGDPVPASNVKRFRYDEQKLVEPAPEKSQPEG